jgi:hypothetical protein
MATEVRRRRGTTIEHSTFTGAVAELTVDLTKDTVVVHDGATQGGFPLLREDFSNVPTTAPFTNISLDTAIFDTAYSADGNEAQGTLYWNEDELTLSLVTNGQTTELGQKVEVHVKNQTGAQINKGEVVYASGTVGASGRILVTKMIADGTVAAKRVLGVAAENIANGADGKVIKFGKLRQINTSTFSDGDILWVSTTTAGGFQNTEPSQANGEIALPIAYVVYSSASVGEIFIRVTPIDENEYTNYTDYVELRSDVIENHLEIESLQDNKVELGELFPDLDKQALGTGDSVTFGGLTVNGNISVTGTVDGRDVSADGADLDELYTTIGLSALTTSEVDQLENINSVTISNTQWGYLGELDQSLTTTSAVTFTTVNTGQGANELYAMNQDVQTTDDVTFNGLTANGATDLNSTLNVQGVLTTQNNVLDDGFTEGWSGTNWRITADGSAELEELRVRGALRVYEFIAKQISTIGGSEILSIANGRVESVDNVSTPKTITIDNVGSPATSFQAGDLWIIQEVDINSGSVTSVYGEVDAVQTGSNANVLEVSVTSGDLSQVEQGNIIVAYGNVSDTARQNIMYRNVDASEDNLIMRLQTGITEFSELQAVGNTRVAFGDLNGYSGLSSQTFGFFAGENANEHVLITDTGIFLKDGSTVGAQLTANEFKIGDSNNNLTFNTSSGAFNIKIGDETDLAASVAEIRQDLIDIYLADQSTFAGIQFLSGQITLKVGADGKVASARLDATGAESAITLRADFFDFQSNDIVLIGDPNQDGGTQAKIALGASANSITIDGTEVGFIADGSGEFKAYADASNYIRLADSALDIKAESFDLATTNLSIDSANELITLGSGTTVTLGKIDANNFGLSLDTHNFWKVSFGEYFFKVGTANNFISFDTSSEELSIDTDTFNLSAGELVIDSSIDKKIVISNNTEPIIAIGDFTFAAEVEDTSSSTATSSSTTNNKTNATATNSATNMDSGFGTYTDSGATATDTNFITLRRDYNNTRGKWIRVQFNYEAPEYNNEGFGDLAIGFTINYFGKTIQQTGRPQDDTNTISGSVDEYLFIPDNAAYSYIEVFALAPAGSATDPTGGLSNAAPDVHGRINLTSLAVTEISNTYTYTDIGNNGFRVYNSGGRNKLDFTDGKAEGTFETLSIGSWDFVLDSDGNLELQYDGTLVQQFTRPT